MGKYTDRKMHIYYIYCTFIHMCVHTNVEASIKQRWVSTFFKGRLPDLNLCQGQGWIILQGQTYAEKFTFRLYV